MYILNVGSLCLLKVGHLVGRVTWCLVWIRTFRSFCARPVYVVVRKAHCRAPRYISFRLEVLGLLELTGMARRGLCSYRRLLFHYPGFHYLKQ